METGWPVTCRWKLLGGSQEILFVLPPHPQPWPSLRVPAKNRKMLARALAAIVDMLLMAEQKDRKNFLLELWNLQSSPEPLTSGLLLTEKFLNHRSFQFLLLEAKGT